MSNSTSKETEVLSLVEIAKYLNVPSDTIVKLAETGRIPSRQASGDWQFLRSMIDDWLETRVQRAGKQKLTEVITTTERIIPLSQLVSPDRIITNVRPGAKPFVLQQLVQPLLETEMIGDGQDYLERLCDREEMLSTAIGHGVAFPHVRRPDETQVTAPCVVLGVCPDGVDFQSLDGGYTYVFAMCCGNSEATHLRLLAKVTLFLRRTNVVQSLRNSNSSQAVMKALIKADCELAVSF